MTELTVVDVPSGHRYEIRRPDGVVVGTAYYELQAGVVAFVHTEVDPAYEGQGVGGALARGALDVVRSRGARVRPLCPFMRGWIDRHPDYGDLVVS